MRPTVPAVLATLTALTLTLGSASVIAPSPSWSATSTSSTALAQAKKREPNPVTPGDFTGYGFDQCLAPTQQMMDVWRRRSPFFAVGIYISGDSRACRNQPNLTPEWISTQLRKGWRLLPITLGPQASCQPRFPRYDDDFTIDPRPGARGRYFRARKMGQNSGNSTVSDAQALGISPGSTLWYDLEGFNISNRHCRESALAFLNAWTRRVKKQGYVAGVYSSAGSGIKMLDDARVNRPNAFTLPDRIWIARWDGVANTSTSYIREDGWRPGGRMKQYRGGHDEVHGGVRINIDSNFLDLGAGSTSRSPRHCNGVTVSFRNYEPIGPPRNGNTSAPRYVKALQCLLKEKGLFSARINGVYNRATTRAVTAWRTKRGLPDDDDRWFRRDWMTLLAFGRRPVLKFGSTGFYVYRVQRALNAANLGTDIANTGVFDAATTSLVKTYQSRIGRPDTGVMDGVTWRKLYRGKKR